MTPRLLILRPQPGAGATAARAAALGFDAIVAPLFAIEPVAWEPPGAGGYDAVMMTSANAARMGGGGLDAWRGHRLYVVGAATAAAARTAGFGEIVTGSRDAAALIAQARADGVETLVMPGKVTKPRSAWKRVASANRTSLSSNISTSS